MPPKPDAAESDILARGAEIAHLRSANSAQLDGAASARPARLAGPLSRRRALVLGSDVTNYKVARARGGVGPTWGITVITAPGAAAAGVIPGVRRTPGRLRDRDKARGATVSRHHGVQA